MSEYQYYEFRAIDKPLDDAQQAEVRSVSTRATITATRFVNEYEWGDFKGDATEWMERYYDAHLYVTNWGTNRVMFRLPGNLLDPDVVDEYCVDDRVSAWTTDDSIVLDIIIDDETNEFDFDHDVDTVLDDIVGVRAELALGDLRPLYLAWLAAYGIWERDEDAFDREADNDEEPPVPPGLNTLTAPQRALAAFLHLDDDLLATAALTSPPLDNTADGLDKLAAWARRLPIAEKDRILERVVRGETMRVRTELLHRFHDNTAPAPRTVGELLDDAARRRAGRQEPTRRAHPAG
ncbi:MAG: hypothetical protein HOY78_23030 [Saccharothrix sp.]|nr:hypothetical protein [Saccharothrix sp.]